MNRLLITHLAQLATPEGKTLLQGKAMRSIRVIEDAALYLEDGMIRLIGTTDDVLSAIDSTTDVQEIDGRGKCALPGFVDSHTHFLFSGFRPDEFIARLEGAQYLDIMRMGGGIQATVNATRAATEQDLLTTGRQRLKQMLSQGVTTVEGKSGYGLDLETELRQLRVMQVLDRSEDIDVVSTYLGGHAIPPEYSGRADEYVDWMVQEMLPRIHEERLAEFCDIFCEKDVFSISQSRKLLTSAKALGFGVKIHADEICSLGGAELAGELNAVSADHLLAASPSGISALAAAGTSATLLPCTAFCLNKPYAPARDMIDHGCGVALASDFNPGSCFCDSIPLLLALAVIQMHMTPEEALTAMTLNGAAALGKASTVGSLEVDKQADIVLLSYPSYRYLFYHTGMNIVETVLKKGKVVYTAPEERRFA